MLHGASSPPSTLRSVTSLQYRAVRFRRDGPPRPTRDRPHAERPAAGRLRRRRATTTARAAKVNQATAGKRLFAAQGCGGCHTFRAAGSTGTQGPNLDDASPSVSKVTQQVKSGGGLMPSFAGKLSDEEIRQIAAFVGVPDAAAKAVVKPFKPDAVRLADCAGKGTECLEQAFGNMTYNDGPKPALAALGARMNSDAAIAGDCHRIVHRMGSAALARFKDRVAPAFVGGLAGLRVGLLPRHHRARLPRQADEPARLAVVAQALRRRPDQPHAVPVLPVPARPRARADDLHGLRCRAR